MYESYCMIHIILPMYYLGIYNHSTYQFGIDCPLLVGDALWHVRTLSRGRFMLRSNQYTYSLRYR